MLIELIIKYVFRKEKEFPIALGTVIQKGSTIALLNSKQIWQKESLKKKIKYLITLNWTPSETIVQSEAIETLMKSIFGNKYDYNDGLFKINKWHNSQNWNFDHLTEADLKKADALNSITILIRTTHRKKSSEALHLKIADRYGLMCILLHPMVVKLPVTSIQWYLDLHSAFAFNEIRKANFPEAENLISYIYELQFIQQKIALSLYELLDLIDYNEKNKNKSLIINAELKAIIVTESVFSYLKASIEKIIIIIGFIYGVKNLESKKTHKSKLVALEDAIPNSVKKLFYFDLIFEFIQAENLQQLNNYRTGILHKKGIADLQPHNYYGLETNNLPFKKIFNVLIEQHSKNTAVLIGTYALLTDELVKLKPPSIKVEEIP